jgi:hypothetical protein
MASLGGQGHGRQDRHAGSRNNDIQFYWVSLILKFTISPDDGLRDMLSTTSPLSKAQGKQLATQIQYPCDLFDAVGRL